MAAPKAVFWFFSSRQFWARASHLMSMLLFMPWCPIDRQYDVGDIAIVPFEREVAVRDLDAEKTRQVETILASYKTIQGESIPRSAFIRCANKMVCDDLVEEEINLAYELLALACFAGLASRDYFTLVGAYCNAECFAMYVQKFEAADFTVLTTRRCDGSVLNAWKIDSIAITAPLHSQSIRKITIDGELVDALVIHRSNSHAVEWGRWQNAISCFNQANTDSDTFRYQTEWVLLCSAFEHLLGARPKAVDVASKFTNWLIPSKQLLVGDARRRSPNWRVRDRPLRDEWMREFYRVRGDFAHGQLQTQQPMVWSAREHLILATIAFPLLAKALLADRGLYEFSREDQVQKNAFESFADTPDFLAIPADQQNGAASHWRRLRQQEQRNLRVARAVRAHSEIEREEAL